jgi:acyl-CoA thioester hydrolase
MLTLGPVGPGVRRATVRVRYAETDKMGVVYYANYWLRQSGLTYREMEAAGVSLPVIEARCEYRQPARYDDDIAIDTQAALVSQVRLRFEYRLTRQGDGALLAEGHTAHAAVDRTGRPCRLPDAVRLLLGHGPQRI